MYVEEEDEVSL